MYAPHNLLTVFYCFLYCLVGVQILTQYINVLFFYFADALLALCIVQLVIGCLLLVKSFLPSNKGSRDLQHSKTGPKSPGVPTLRALRLTSALSPTRSRATVHPVNDDE